MAITETPGECGRLPAADVYWPVSGAHSFVLWQNHSSRYRQNNHLLPEERDGGEVGGGKMYKYSLSINITSEFLTWNGDVIHKAAVRLQATFCVKTWHKNAGEKNRDVWASVDPFAVLIWAPRNSAAVFL